MTLNRLELIEEMLEKNPADPFLKYAAALEFRKLGDQQKASRFLFELRKSQPDYLATYYQLGKLLEEEGKTKIAIEIYKEGREIAKKSNDLKTLGELSEALLILDEEEGEMW